MSKATPIKQPAPPLLPESGLITPDELATVCRTSRDHIIRLTRQGLIPSLRLGRRHVYDCAAIKQFIQSGGAKFAGVWKKEAGA